MIYTTPQGPRGETTKFILFTEHILHNNATQNNPVTESSRDLIDQDRSAAGIEIFVNFLF